MTSNKIVNAFRLFLAQIKSRTNGEVKFIGQDHLGNKYYEKHRARRHHHPIQRYFENDRLTEGHRDLVEFSKVPPVWDAWLRHKRRDPPDPKEVEDGELYYKYQQDLAASKQAKSEPSVNKSDNFLKQNRQFNQTESNQSSKGRH